jgi:ferredoxin
MKTIIYYFTGTGNSLAVARKIASVLDDCDLVPVASQKDTTVAIIPDAERVGIVCPVYFLGLPVMVAEFAARLDCSSVRYTFAIVTLGGSGGSTTLRQLDHLIRNQHGRGLDAGFTVKMPGNYILLYSSPTGERQTDLLAAADSRINLLIPVIRRCEHRNIPLAIFGRFLYALAYPRFVSRSRSEDRKFTVSDACTSCGTCARVCPADDIEIVQGRPVWKGRCEVCCACIHVCPTEAIQAGPRTARRQRYRNPSTSIADLAEQAGRGGSGEVTGSNDL